jgi:flagellar biosynthesis protein FlhB
MTASKATALMVVGIIGSVILTGFFFPLPQLQQQIQKPHCHVCSVEQFFLMSRIVEVET